MRLFSSDHPVGALSRLLLLLLLYCRHDGHDSVYPRLVRTSREVAQKVEEISGLKCQATLNLQPSESSDLRVIKRRR
jgi:hypothetical protein